MQTFWQWLSQFRETYFSFDAQQYNRLFDEELEKVIVRTSDTAHREILERMRGFGWLSYIAAAVRMAGYHDQREVQERTHDVAVKLLTGMLFRGFDDRVSGPMDLRFKRSVSNAIRNLVEKEKNRRRFIPTISIGQEFERGCVMPDELSRKSPSPDDADDKVVDGFRALVQRQLGKIGVAVLDVRLDGGETKSLADNRSLGNPSTYVIKRVVQQIKQLARAYAAAIGDSELLRRIDKALASESETVAKRRASTAMRTVVGV